MLVIGLTGTVASGKNFVADIFRNLGVSVFDSDAEVHKIFVKNTEILEQISQHFPEAIQDEKIDRKKLGVLVFNNPEKLEILENIIHPIVKKHRDHFIQKASRSGRQIVMLNIPLLFEKNIHLECDKNILVMAPKLLQRQRFLDREKSKILAEKNTENLPADNLLIAKFENILQNQFPNSRKRKMADFIIKNDQNKSSTLNQVMKIFNKLTKNDSE